MGGAKKKGKIKKGKMEMDEETDSSSNALDSINDDSSSAGELSLELKSDSSSASELELEFKDEQPQPQPHPIQIPIPVIHSNEAYYRDSGNQVRSIGILSNHTTNANAREMGRNAGRYARREHVEVLVNENHFLQNRVLEQFFGGLYDRIRQLRVYINISVRYRRYIGSPVEFLYFTFKPHTLFAFQSFSRTLSNAQVGRRGGLASKRETFEILRKILSMRIHIIGEQNMPHRLKPQRQNPHGGYFRYYHLLKYCDLSIFGIFTKSQIKDGLTHVFQESCLIDALKPQIERYASMDKEYDASSLLDRLRYLLSGPNPNKIVLLKHMKPIALLLDGLIRVTIVNGDFNDLSSITYKSKTYPSIRSQVNENRIYKIGLIDNHWVLNDKYFKLMRTESILNYDLCVTLNNEHWIHTIAKYKRNGNIKYKSKTKGHSPVRIIATLLHCKEKHLKSLDSKLLYTLNYRESAIINSENIPFDPKMDKGRIEKPNCLMFNNNQFFEINPKLQYKSTDEFTQEELDLIMEHREGTDIILNPLNPLFSSECILRNRLELLLNVPTIFDRLILELVNLKPDKNKEEIILNVKNKLNELHRIADGNGMYCVKYKRKSGRRYSISGRGLQGSLKYIRYLLSNPLYWDLDISNCHPTLMIHLIQHQWKINQHEDYRALTIEWNALHTWFSERQELINDLQFIDQSVSNFEVKNTVLSIINGSLTAAKVFYSKHPLCEFKLENFSYLNKPFFYCLQNEIELLHAFVNDETTELNIKYKTFLSNVIPEKQNIKSFISNELCELEDFMICQILNILIQKKFIYKTFFTLMFDGIYFIPNKNVTHNQIVDYFETEVLFKDSEGNHVNMSLTLQDDSVEDPIEFIDLLDDYDLSFYGFNILTEKFESESNLDLLYRQNQEPKNEFDKTYNVCFFDFETNVTYINSDGINEHRPFLVCWCINGGDVLYATGDDCGLNFLYQIPDNTLMIAHNLDYDWRFIVDYLIPVSMVYFNGKIMRYNCKFKRYGRDEKTFTFVLKDSYCLIHQPLRNFGSMFGLKIDKEVMPYEAYNIQTLDQMDMDISYACSFLKSEEDKIHFLKMIRALGFQIGTDKFDHWGYAIYYCSRDVEVLRDGYNTFRKWMLDATAIGIEGYQPMPLDADKQVSISGMAHRYFVNNGAFEGIPKLGGLVRDFIQRSVRGGRVCLWNNYMIRVDGNVIYGKIPSKKINQEATEEPLRNMGDFESILEHSSDLNESKEFIIESKPTHYKINDFDGVSLYPSAMKRLEGYPMGLPKVLKPEECNMEFLNQIEIVTYYVEIKILHVGKHRPNPILGFKNKELELIYDDTLWKDKTFIVSHIGLEDLITFHNIDFIILRGLYFNEGLNSNASQVIQCLFNLRLKYKQSKNPMQTVIKLMMNSGYGKTILKPIRKNHKIHNSEDLCKKYVIRNYCNVEYYHPIGEHKRWITREYQNLMQHYNYVQVGSLILDISKRIMNEVIQLADDLDIKVLYQDTDSMHFDGDKLDLLINNFKEIYGRDLVGTSLGQFHCDFEKPLHSDLEPYSNRCYFLAKKIYCEDVFYHSNGDFYTHIRMKGISDGAIKIKAKELNCEVTEIYKRLYNGETLDFDLCKAGPKFDRRNDLTIGSKDMFIRSIRL